MTPRDFIAKVRGFTSCGDPGCIRPWPHAVDLVAQCHPKQGLRVSVDAAEGTITITCQVCKREVAKLDVPRGTP